MSTTRKKVSDLVGFKVGRLEVIAYSGKGAYDKHYWNCVCECGTMTTVNTSRLTGAKPVLSCGCLRKEKLLENRCSPTRHGLHRHKLYAIHCSMKHRCTNPNSQRWSYYGGKGVSVCDEWQDFMTFYSWAISNGYQEGLSIDRIDSDGDYHPDNCQWITVAENTRKSNVRNSRTKVQEDSCHP